MAASRCAFLLLRLRRRRFFRLLSAGRQRGLHQMCIRDRFTVDYYTGGYALIHIVDGNDYLVVPENKPVPDGLADTTVVLTQPPVSYTHLKGLGSGVMHKVRRADGNEIDLASLSLCHILRVVIHAGFINVVRLRALVIQLVDRGKAAADQLRARIQAQRLAVEMCIRDRSSAGYMRRGMPAAASFCFSLCASIHPPP